MNFEKIPERIMKKGEYGKNKSYKVRKECLRCRKIFFTEHTGCLYCPKCQKKVR